MTLRRACRHAIALGMILFPGTAIAAGTITGLTVSPDPAQVNQNVIATLQGQGACGEVVIDFGDGSPAAHLQDVDFKQSLNVNAPPHAFSAAKTYHLTASPGSGCEGQASKDLVVGGSTVFIGGNLAGLLCAILDNCGGKVGLEGAIKDHLVTFDVAPHIDTFFFTPFTPGAQVLALGKNFGSPGPQNQFHLFLTTDNKDVLLSIDEWKSTYVTGTIPPDLVGVHDGPAEFYVKRGNAESNHFPVTFTASREQKFLPPIDVKMIACGSDSNFDRCSIAWQDASDGSYDGPDPCQGAIQAICGIHANVWGASEDDTGTDTYEINLENGWVFDICGFAVDVESGEGSASISSQCPLGASSWKPSIQWSVTPADELRYISAIWILGPKGIPW